MRAKRGVNITLGTEDGGHTMRRRNNEDIFPGDLCRFCQQSVRLFRAILLMTHNTTQHDDDDDPPLGSETKTLKTRTNPARAADEFPAAALPTVPRAVARMRTAIITQEL